MTDRSIGIAQIVLAFFFVIGFFTVVVLFLLGYVRTPTDYKEALIALLGFCTASLGQIVGYFFARQRTQPTTGATS